MFKSDLLSVYYQFFKKYSRQNVCNVELVSLIFDLIMRRYLEMHIVLLVMLFPTFFTAWIYLILYRKWRQTIDCGKYISLISLMFCLNEKTRSKCVKYCNSCIVIYLFFLTLICFCDVQLMCLFIISFKPFYNKFVISSVFPKKTISNADRQINELSDDRPRRRNKITDASSNKRQG